MNRLKVWIFTLLVVAAGAAALLSHASGEKAAALAALDARLAGAAAQAGVALRASLRETAGAAALAARDPALRAALAPRAEPAPLPRRGVKAPPPPPVEPAQDDAAQSAAAAAALEGAERALGAPLSPGRTISAANAAALARRPVGGDADALLRGAVEGTARAAFARADGKLLAAAGAPAGEAAGVVVLAPVGDAWARALSSTAGVEVTVAGTELKPAGNAPPADAQAIVAAATRAGGKPVDVGEMGKVDVVGRALPVVLPRLGLLGGAPAHRALAIPVEGLKGAALVLSAQAGPALAATAALQWRGLALLAGLLLVGLVFGFLVKPSEIVSAVPEPLLQAADKIERGDFSARAPPLAGKLGTLANALNRAAHAAEGVGREPAVPVPGTATHELFQEPPPPPEAEPSAFDFPSRPPRQKAAEPGLSGDPFQAAPVRPATSPGFEAPAAAPAPPPRAAPPPIPDARMTRTMPAVTGPDDESSHWQQVFQDFVRTRAECGEPSEGLTFERFRAKLESNKATLVAKYQCRTVRFQVYVKEGKAALKATPVR
ncbi:MAG: MXAN_5187 family protein [Anaeromyxobacteraceae bacterium]